MQKTLIALFVAVLAVGLIWIGCSNEPTNVMGPTAELQPSAKPISTPPGLERAMAVQEEHTPRLMALSGVVGTATGLGSEGRSAVLVLTETPGAAGIPGSLDGIPVIVKVTGEIRAFPKPPWAGGGGGGDDETIDPTSRFDRPVPIGVSTGHPDITAGTIGARVTDGTHVYALSNNHVYANENLASPNDKVIQPGTYDGGVLPGDEIGTLSDFVALVFDGSPNRVDAAIALSTTADLGNATPSDGYGTPKSTTATATINQSVVKYGRTTGQTKGKVYALNATVNVGYDSGTALFVDQIIITPGGFSAGGDSGSLIVIHDKKGKREGPAHRQPVGLLFAGSSTVTIANPIDEVLDRFNVTIDGE